MDYNNSVNTRGVMKYTYLIYLIVCLMFAEWFQLENIAFVILALIFFSSLAIFNDQLGIR